MNEERHRDLWTAVEARLTAFDADPRQSFTIKEALEILHISPRTLRRRIKQARNKRRTAQETRTFPFKDTSLIRRQATVLRRSLVRELLEAEGLCSKGLHRMTAKCAWLHLRPCDGKHEVICLQCRNAQKTAWLAARKEKEYEQVNAGV